MHSSIAKADSLALSPSTDTDVKLSGEALPDCTVTETCDEGGASGGGPSPPHTLWQHGNGTLPDTAITTVAMELTFTSTDLATRINESHIFQSVRDYATSDGLTKADFELRVVDSNVSFYLPSTTGSPWAPPDLVSDDCGNLLSFNAYFVGDNVTTIKHVKGLFDDPNAGRSRSSALKGDCLIQTAAADTLFLPICSCDNPTGGVLENFLADVLPSEVLLCRLAIDNTNFLHVPGKTQVSHHHTLPSIYV